MGILEWNSFGQTVNSGRFQTSLLQCLTGHLLVDNACLHGLHIAKGCQSEADNELWCRTVVVSIALLKPKSVDGSRRLCLHGQPSRILD
ncbi:hypothetical protein T05_4272 [Trichinella murrelli]|uniref:Uncharacterized protein n=1 Tax=Trichinella murrelli TaxID=144512 RepID=A0A0V0UBV4_9BILA|nr:hypothetical protein T05_4272 [Trichinella murrelli]